VYTSSPDYVGDLAAARAVWEPSRVLGGAGMFVFTTYATLPLLTSVGSVDGSGDALMLRKVVGVRREKELLVRLLGIGDSGGLVDPGVRRMLTELGDRHRRLRGMRAEYLDLFAGVIALAPLRVRATVGLTLDAALYDRYWRYMRHALGLLGAQLGERRAVSRSCARFVGRHTGAGPRTAAYLEHLYAAHPAHMRTCVAALFPQTRCLLRETTGVRTP
jgi:hypothetical protein